MLELAFLVLFSLPNGANLSSNGHYEESEQVLSTIKVPGGNYYDTYTFSRLLNNFALNNRVEATKYAKMLEESFTQSLPVRHKALAYMMTEDLKQWQDDDLSDIERDMKKSTNRLGKAQSGKTTQDIQKTIVDKLDKMIKEQEGKGGKGDGEGNPNSKPMPGSVPSGSESSPAPDSNIMGGSGSGKVDEKKLRQAAEQWGNLPPAKRAKIIEDITRDVPAKYKQAIEEYFKALNRQR